MNKKKIIFVINSMGCGGAEKSLLSLLSLIDYSRFDVSLLMLIHGGMFESLIPEQVHIEKGFKYTEFCSLGAKEQFKSFNLKYLFARAKTAASIRKNNKSKKRLHDAQAYWRGCAGAFETYPKQFDVAIAWGQGTPTHIVAQKISADKKFAWVNADYESVGHNKDFDRRYYEKYNKIICVSEKLSDIFKSVYPEFSNRIETIHDILNPDLILKMSQSPCEIKKEGCPIFVTVGRLVSQKGYDTAAQAAQILKEGGLNFKWYVVGDGNRSGVESYIEKFNVSDCFILLGGKSNPYPYIKSADVYVQTSKFEGFCLTLAEARMLNIPCVTTEFDVVYEQMIPEKNGLVVKIDPQSVAEGIMRLLNDKELYSSIKDFQQNEKKGNIEEIEKIYRLID